LDGPYYNKEIGINNNAEYAVCSEDPGMKLNGKINRGKPVDARR
jgi:hypothetical protein